MTVFVEFQIPGVPVGKARPRITRKGKFTPLKSAQYQRAVSILAKQAMGTRRPTRKPVAVEIEVFMPTRRRWSRKRTTEAHQGRFVPTVKPDLSNVTKGIEDGCNRVVWHDDAQIVDATLSKRYAARPCVRVKVFELSAKGTPV